MQSAEFHSTIITSAVAIAFLGARTLAQPSFTPLGDLPGGVAYSEAWGISADGSTVVGDSIISGSILFGGTYAAFTWTAGAGMTDIYHLAGIGTTCRAYAANATGSMVVGMADYNTSPVHIVAFIWFQGVGVNEIGDLPGGGDRGAARAVSANGSTLAGQGESDSGAEAFRYIVPDLADEGFFGLGDLPGGIFGSDGFGISADGHIIVGSSSSADGVQAFRWVQGSGALQPLGFLAMPDGFTKFSEAYAASADGSVIVGLSRSNSSVSTNGWEAFRWSARQDAAGGMQPLGDLPGGAFLSAAYATSADGSIIVGRAGVQGPCNPFGCQTAGRAFIWDHRHGLRDLTIVLAGLGINLSGWQLTEARGVSADGRIIAGTGTNPTGNTEAWRADLGQAPNPADVNDDGVVNTADLLQVIAHWGPCPAMPAGCSADVSPPPNGDGQVNASDLLMVINNWG